MDDRPVKDRIGRSLKKGDTVVILDCRYKANIGSHAVVRTISLCPDGEWGLTLDWPEAQSFNLREYGTDGTTIEEVYDPDTGDRSYVVTDGDQTFGLPDSDYNGVSFRSNLVLRWELRPGSTLFVVWQQNLSEGRDPGSEVRFGDLFGGFRAPGHNALAIKMNYWIPF